MRICLVSNEILGAHRNGGIGTATSNLAILLAENGHFVTLFYVGHMPLDSRDPWAVYYKAANVSVMHFPGSQARISPFWMKQSVEIYEQLRGRNFDLIIFQEWMALGHACIVAKRAGVAFDRTVLVVITHSSTPWLLEANRSFPQTPEHLALIHMERQAIELSDAVVSPSRYLVGWMKQAEWKLPDRTDVIPHFLEGAELLGAKVLLETSPRRLIEHPSHLVFFGRLEERKGINIFLSAVASEELRPFQFKLTFLGRPATRSSEDVIAFLAEHRPDLLADLDIRADLSSDGAQAFLSQTDCIPVIPSLIDNSPCVIYEALKLGLPFIAAATGGIPELINAEDRQQFLFAPTKSALACKLQEVLSSNSWGAPRSAHNQHEIGQRWLRWIEEHAPEKLPVGRPYVSNGAADVTVVITHFERPVLAEQNLRALGMQTDQRFNVVLVDDGSKSEAALAFLDRAAHGISGLSIKVVRQSNKYLGAARNEGLRHAETPFVIFLDDDNIPFPNMIEVFRRAAHASGADIVTCQMQFFHEATGEPDPQELISGERWAFPGGPIALGVVQNCFGDATAIYKRELFEHVGCFHEIMGVTHEDWQLHLRACLEGLSLLSLPFPLFWYRVTPGTMIRSTNGYENMRVVASALHKKVPRSFATAIDFMIGAHGQPLSVPNQGSDAPTLAHLYPEDARNRLIHIAHSRVIQSTIRILLGLRFDHAIRWLATLKRRMRTSSMARAPILKRRMQAKIEMSTNRTLTETIAADWANNIYYENAEDPEWLAVFWHPESRFKQRFDTLNLDSVLEIACGHGRHTAQFIDKAGRVAVVDINQSNIDACKERFRGIDKVEFIVNDGSSLCDLEDKRFTSVFSYDAMVHFEFEDIISYIKECYRVLVPGGRALLHISDYSTNPGSLYNVNPHWRNFMSFEVASHVGQRAGFALVDGDRFTWGDPANGNIARDCLVLFEKKEG